MEPYTVALTSCGRFDLLQRTLHSLLSRLDGPLAGVTVVEDSCDPGIYDVVRTFAGQYKINVIFNDSPLGQVRSIDRLYSTVDTEWIFHCEDDWEFYANGFIEKSFVILKEFAHLSMVSVRDRADLEENRFLQGVFSVSGIDFFAIDPAVRPVWSGLSFNPGLRRMREYRIVGPYDNLDVAAEERHVSDCYRKLGYSIAYLAEPAVRHIGDGRHVRNQAKPPDFGSKMQRSIRRRLASLQRILAPDSDPIRKAGQRQEEAGGRPALPADWNRRSSGR